MPPALLVTDIWQVVGSERSGVVYLHMVKGPGYPDWNYRVFALDVPGMKITPVHDIKLQELSDMQVILGSILKAVMLLRTKRNRASRC